MRLASTCVLALFLAGTGAGKAQELKLPGLGGESRLTTGSAAPQVGAELLLDHTGVTPGGSVEAAVRFTVPDGWHIYWKNRGEGGLETQLTWRLPAGWSAGDPRFPKPKRHIDEADAHTFVMEGEPTILATIKAPADAKPGEEVEIGVDAKWLACRTMCFPGRKSLSAKLRVVGTAEEVKPANEDDFAFARKQLPTTAEKAKALKSLQAVASVDKIGPAAKFTIAVVVEVAAGYHVNSHEPLEPGLIPTDVFPERTNGVEIGRPTFPAGKVEETTSGKLSVYRDKVAILLPAQANGDLKGDVLRFAGVLTYQACSDKTNTCDPPAAVEWSVTVPVKAAGEAATAVHPEIFSAAAQPASGGGFKLDRQLRVTTVREQHSLLAWLGLALLAGLILNVTPCVLPVISIKILSFVQQASKSPARVFKLGLAFSLGMMIVFNGLAIMATALGLVWGQHFQSPVFTVAMASVVFAFGLSMFGVFTLGVPQSVGDLAVRAEGEGYAGSIAKGALATVMGTPCLGPFLGPVLVWASGQPAGMVFLVFNTIGAGMALPYILLTANPRWLRFVPKAGPWLTTFKQAMAFLLMGTVVYLLYILEGQLGGQAVVWALVFLTAVSIACWMLGRFITYNTSGPGRLAWMGIAAAMVLAAGVVVFGHGVDWNSSHLPTTQASTESGRLPWVPFSLEKLTELTAQNKTVLLDITARWCPNCKTNSALVFNTPEMAAAVEKYGVVPMLADWTGYSKDIGDLIEKLAPGASIPLAAVFPAGRADEPIVMLGIVTRQQVIDNLAKAASGQ